jgi:hypothetical protein
LDGKEIWTKKAPKESKVYNEEEYTDPKKVWGRGVESKADISWEF